MQAYQRQFIEFLLKHQALKFGEFTLKSGRQSPYFFNLGVFNTGASLFKLATFYANAMQAAEVKCDVLFGPAYKGIPLACAISIALHQQYQQNTPYCFNRKEKKDHGDTGSLVGAPLKGHVVMVDDVITAGTTVHETLNMMKGLDATLSTVLIAFDRQERGTGKQSAIQEITQEHHIPVVSIITLDNVITFLEEQGNASSELEKIHAYQAEYGL